MVGPVTVACVGTVPVPVTPGIAVVTLTPGCEGTVPVPVTPGTAVVTLTPGESKRLQLNHQL